MSFKTTSPLTWLAFPESAVTLLGDCRVFWRTFLESRWRGIRQVTETAGVLLREVGRRDIVCAEGGNAYACRRRAQPTQPHLVGSDGKCGKMEKILPCERYDGEEGTRHHSGLADC